MCYILLLYTCDPQVALARLAHAGVNGEGEFTAGGPLKRHYNLTHVDMRSVKADYN